MAEESSNGYPGLLAVQDLMGFLWIEEKGKLKILVSNAPLSLG
jgi:hypothetical protein